MSDRGAPRLLLNAEQKMLSKTSHELIRQRAPAARIRSFRDSKDPVGFSRDLWREMADLGWIGLQIPEEYEGSGLGFFDLCIILEQSGRELMPEPFISTLLLGSQALLLGGTEEHKHALLPRVAAGETLLALGYEEIGAPTVAERVGDRFELNGKKIQVLDGHVADRLIITAKTAKGRQTLFLVDPADPRVTVTRQHRIDGLGASIVRLDRVSVGSDATIGQPDEGDALLRLVLERAAIGVAAQMLGGSEQAFEDTLRYLQEREQFDVPIGSFQALQHRAVSVFTNIALTRSIVLAAARSIDEGSEGVSRLSAAAKAIASETFLHAAKEAIQMHGGIGVTDEHDIGLYMKRAQSAYVTFGSPSQHRQRWAELHGY